MSTEAEQKVKLLSSDQIEIETGMSRPPGDLHHRRPPSLTPVAERKIAERSMLIKNMIEDLGAPGEEAIPIMNVSADSPSNLTSPGPTTAAPH